MATSNVVISEGQVTFKRVEGHKHDGLTSSLIDTSKYSMFDFIATENAKDASRAAKQQNNKNTLKTFIISTIEGRVLNPEGIRIQANAISAREIIAGTITADELSSNIVLVNNVIRSNNFINNTGTYTGWAIYSNGTGIFNNIQIRGNLVAGTGVYANTNTPIFANIGGYFSLGSNFTWNGTTLTIKGTLQFPDGSTPGTFDNGDALTAGNIGGITIGGSSIRSTDYDANPTTAGFAIHSDGTAIFNEVTVRGTIYAGGGEIGGWLIGANSITAGSTALYSNGYLSINSGTIASGVTIGGAAASTIVTNSTNAVQPSGVKDNLGGAGVTTITGGKISTGIISSVGGARTINLDTGAINFGNFTVSAAGAAVFAGSITGSDISGSSVTVGTFDGTSTGLQITSDGFIRGSGGGVKIKNWGTGTGTALFGDSIITPTVIVDKISVSNGTNEFEADVNNVNYITDISFTSSTADYAGIRILRSGTTAASHHMVFGKIDGTYVGGIRYRSNTNNTMTFVGDITGTSDIRLKENIKILSNSLSIVNKINPVQFNFIKDPDTLENGFIAQELFEVYPMAVEQGGDDPLTNPWSVMQPRLIPVLTGAIKELLAKVESLETRMQTLEGV